MDTFVIQNNPRPLNKVIPKLLTKTECDIEVANEASEYIPIEEDTDITTLNIKLETVLEDEGNHESGPLFDWAAFRSCLTLDSGNKFAPAAFTEIQSTNESNISHNQKEDMNAENLKQSPGKEPPKVASEKANPRIALTKILTSAPANSQTPQFYDKILHRTAISLIKLSKRQNNLVRVEINNSQLKQLPQQNVVSPFLDFQNVIVSHESGEFVTFCSCPSCLSYREVVMQLIVEQHTITDIAKTYVTGLLTAYGKMLKNPSSTGKLIEISVQSEKLKWITTGFNRISRKMAILYDSELPDEMMLVLYSTVLMVDNPVLLLQITADHIGCVLRSFVADLEELLKPQLNKSVGEEILKYILRGYEDLCHISRHVASFMFAYENEFLQQFSIDLVLVAKRLYQQHVYLNFIDTIFGCVIMLREGGTLPNHKTIICDYTKFHVQMCEVEQKWLNVWTKLNNYNLTETELQRRESLMKAYNILDTVIKDSNSFGLDRVEINKIEDIIVLSSRNMAWQRIMSCTNTKFSNVLREPPNTLVRDEKCKKCKNMLDHHGRNCKCLTCSIAGGPVPFIPSCDLCLKCIEKYVTESETNQLVFSKANQTNIKSKNRKKSLEHSVHELFEDVEQLKPIENEASTYHISWAVFKNLKDRHPYNHNAIDEKLFCQNCSIPACSLARAILNNVISRRLSLYLIYHYQPLDISEPELDAIFKRIILYNSTIISSTVGQDLSYVDSMVVKIYWTFLISLFANNFLLLVNKQNINIDALELHDNDIKICDKKIIGNNDDVQFSAFLDYINGSIPPNLFSEFNSDFNSDKLQEGVKSLIDTYISDVNTIPTEPKKNPTTEIIPTETSANKICLDKSHKCCVALSDSCKDANTCTKLLKKDCNHGRMNETRARLRKKLSKLVNARKNMEGMQSEVDDNDLNKMNDLAEKIATEDTLHKSEIEKVSSKLMHRNINEKSSFDGVSNVKEQTGNMMNSMSKDGKRPSSSESVAKEKYNQETKPPNVANENWVKEALSFIEGTTSTDAENRKQPLPINPKKAAKKAKQKMRKEEEKRIAELHDLRSQFFDIYFKEFFEKQELKDLKTSKKCEKRKTSELETNIKKLQRAKSKLETVILELIATVKLTNSDFKFAYLPSKEQQIDRINEMKSKSKSLTTKPEIEKQQFLMPAALRNSHPPDMTCNTFKQIYHEPSLKIDNTQNSLPFTQSQKIGHVLANSNFHDNVSINAHPEIDSSKRIVTIRRVNLPNFPEPQVTVTAKGTSPDQDKLLYTFVNGQLVQAELGTSMQTQRHAQQYMNREQAASLQPVRCPSVSKSQLKKEKKRLAKLRNEQSAQAIESSKIPSHAKSPMPIEEMDNSKNVPKKTIAKLSNSIKETKVKSVKPIDNSKVSKKESSLYLPKTENKIAPTMARKMEKKIKLSCDPGKSNSSKQKEAGSKRIGNQNYGQLENNPYKSLHLSNSDSDSETDSDVDLEEVEEENQEISQNPQVAMKEKLNKCPNKTSSTKQLAQLPTKKSKTISNKKFEGTTHEKVKSTLYNQNIEHHTGNGEGSGSKNKRAQNTSRPHNTIQPNIVQTHPTFLKRNSQSDERHITRQMQNLNISACQQHFSNKCNSSTSIMDQLNNGVEVENLALPPGITLTKVDPEKKEILNQKSDSISKVLQPMRRQVPKQHAFSFIPNYYNGPQFSAVPTLTGNGYEQGGIIMVETNPSSNNIQEPVRVSSKSKSSKNKKRQKSAKSNANANVNATHQEAADGDNAKMITLRNPMFHTGSGLLPGSVQQPSGPVQAHPIGRVPLPVHLATDQPAAIIKNENGMFTIRNPALHQAVTNGLVLGGYKPNVPNHYYAPTSNLHPSEPSSLSARNPSFSYFSNATEQYANATVSPSIDPIGHENHTVGLSSASVAEGSCKGLNTNSPKQKYISAIGSEIKNAHQQKQRPMENIWSGYTHDASNRLPINKEENFVYSPYSELPNQNVVPNWDLQQKYKHSNYYNGFDMFSAINNNECSIFKNSDCCIPHNCDDDSPPPSVSEYKPYLQDIPNAGVIRYDNASFLKNLVSGQNLNNEVSIHNASTTNQIRKSPIPHQVEITPIYPKNVNSISEEQLTTESRNCANRTDGTKNDVYAQNKDFYKDEHKQSTEFYNGFRYNFQLPGDNAKYEENKPS